MCASAAVTIGGSAAPFYAITDESRVELGHPFPNPAVNSSQVDYSVMGTDNRSVTIWVSDVSGRRVRTLVNGVHSPGRYTTTWDGVGDDGMPVKSGVYFIRTSIEDSDSVARITLVR